MAAQLKLRWQYRNEGAIIGNLDLYSGSDGFTVAHGRWSAAVIPAQDVSITEVITLRVAGSSQDDLATKLQNLAAKLLEITHRVENVSAGQEVWLINQLTNETNERKAIIFNASFEIDDTLQSSPTDPGNFISDCRLALTRGHWSRDRSLLNLTSISTLGGSSNYGTIVGDAPARLSILQWRGRSGGGGPLHEFWTGFRTDKFGTVANFVPVWECEDGTLGTDAGVDTTSEVDTASPGSGSGAYVEVASGGTETLVTRATIEVEDVTASFGDQGGTFAVLLRAKVGSSTNCRVRLLDGYSSSSDFRTQSRVTVDGTNWFMHALGTVTIPPIGLPLPSRMRKYALRIQAEWVSGLGNLLLDCLVLVPMAEGFIHATGGVTEYVGVDERESEVRHFPDLTYDAVALTGGSPIATLDIEPSRYGLPVGAGTLYLVAQRETQQVLADLLDMYLYYAPHWLVLRGSE